MCSPLGRPKGKPDPGYSIGPVRQRLYEFLKAREADTSRVELLENLRYNPGEEANDPEFVASLVKNQDMYVDDSFGPAHRPTPHRGPPGVAAFCGRIGRQGGPSLHGWGASLEFTENGDLPGLAALRSAAA